MLHTMPERDRTLGTRLRLLRERLAFTRKQAAEAVGVSPHTIVNWELGRSRPGVEEFDSLLRLFGVSMDAMLGRTPPPGNRVTVGEATPGLQHAPLPPGAFRPTTLALLPVYGHIRGGSPALLSSDIVDRYAVDAERVRADQHFVLRVSGDSMDGGPRPIADGDLVIVHQQDTCEEHDTAVVTVGDEGGTLKHVRMLDGGQVMLYGANCAYTPTIHPAEEVRVWGIVVESVRDHRRRRG
jgi:SOS-response transcriptional repressor LexA